MELNPLFKDIDFGDVFLCADDTRTVFIGDHFDNGCHLFFYNEDYGEMAYDKDGTFSPSYPELTIIKKYE